VPSKEKPKNKPITIPSPKGEIILFGPSIHIQTDIALPEGISQATPIQFRWEEPGQHLSGQYCGQSKLESSYKEQGFFFFHEVRLFNNVMVGFIGSTQIDRVLGKLEPYAYDVHIIFIEEKELPGKKTFKSFQIFTRTHVQTEVEKLASPAPKTPF